MDNQTKYYTKSNDYYKKYYAEHKQELLAKQCAKVECKFCGKQVQKVNMAKHQLTKLCAKLHEKNVQDEIRHRSITRRNGIIIDERYETDEEFKQRMIEKYGLPTLTPEQQKAKTQALLDKLQNNNVKYWLE